MKKIFLAFSIFFIFSLTACQFLWGNDESAMWERESYPETKSGASSPAGSNAGQSGGSQTEQLSDTQLNAMYRAVKREYERRQTAASQTSSESGIRCREKLLKVAITAGNSSDFVGEALVYGEYYSAEGEEHSTSWHRYRFRKKGGSYVADENQLSGTATVEGLTWWNAL